jgi:hypothetical protein
MNEKPAATSPDLMRAWIDNATYEQLLRWWLFAPIGDPMFQGKMGDYYDQVMARRWAEVGNERHVATSKRIGWEV